MHLRGLDPWVLVSMSGFQVGERNSKIAVYEFESVSPLTSYNSTELISLPDYLPTTTS